MGQCRGKSGLGSGKMRKDLVVVPTTLPLGDYVLGWRWDSAGGNQVWVSCSSVRLVAAGRAVRAEHGDEDEDGDEHGDEDEDGALYTEEEYAELEAAFES